MMVFKAIFYLSGINSYQDHWGVNYIILMSQPKKDPHSKDDSPNSNNHNSGWSPLPPKPSTVPGQSKPMTDSLSAAAQSSLGSLGAQNLKKSDSLSKQEEKKSASTQPKFNFGQAGSTNQTTNVFKHIFARPAPDAKVKEEKASFGTERKVESKESKKKEMQEKQQIAGLISQGAAKQINGGQPSPSSNQFISFGAAQIEKHNTSQQSGGQNTINNQNQSSGNPFQKNFSPQPFSQYQVPPPVIKPRQQIKKETGETNQTGKKEICSSNSEQDLAILRKQTQNQANIKQQTGNIQSDAQDTKVNVPRFVGAGFNPAPTKVNQQTTNLSANNAFIPKPGVASGGIITGQTINGNTTTQNSDPKDQNGGVKNLMKGQATNLFMNANKTVSSSNSTNNQIPQNQKNVFNNQRDPQNQNTGNIFSKQPGTPYNQNPGNQSNQNILPSTNPNSDPHEFPVMSGDAYLKKRNILYPPPNQKEANHFEYLENSFENVQKLTNSQLMAQTKKSIENIFTGLCLLHSKPQLYLLQFIDNKELKSKMSDLVQIYNTHPSEINTAGNKIEQNQKQLSTLLVKLEERLENKHAKHPLSQEIENIHQIEEDLTDLQLNIPQEGKQNMEDLFSTMTGIEMELDQMDECAEAVIKRFNQ